jgi:hypothetical protein
MNFETRQDQHHTIGKLLIAIGIVVALAEMIWRTQVRHTSLATGKVPASESRF